MSKHSKNCTGSTVFTYQEKQKLKNVYGTIETRIGQDSVKKFDECSICHSHFIEPTACDHGHTFCRSCVIEYLVKQKKRLQDISKEYEKQTLKEKKEKEEKELKNDVELMEKFETFEGFGKVFQRSSTFQESNPSQGDTPPIDKNHVKPTGIYELNESKDKYIKSSFWTIENTPQIDEKISNEPLFVKCPGSGKEHKLTMKKLRNLQCKELSKDQNCWICSKEIGRQKIGCYKCGHVICQACKSDKCEVCSKKEGWMELEGSLSAFTSHNKSEVKTYTHAFMN